MTRFASIAAIALALGLAGGVAMAQSSEMSFDAVDDNGDGEITRDEFAMYAESSYTAKLQELASGDQLSTRDYAESRINRNDQPVDTINIDVDEDDQISMEEALADWEESFDALDEDGDDVVTEDEWDAKVVD